MLGRSPHKFRDIELDLELLLTPFKVQTNWHVITGASCSGKTTLTDQLADQGFSTVPEAARIFIKQELAKGLTIEEIRHDQAALTRQVYDMMLIRESRLHPGELAFLDRALPDAPAFYRLAGMDPNEVLPDCFQYHYTSVFMLDRLPYQLDGVRAADDPTAEYLDTWIKRDYKSLGYNFVRVPVLPPEERLSLILERLTENERRNWSAKNG